MSPPRRDALLPEPIATELLADILQSTVDAANNGTMKNECRRYAIVLLARLARERVQLTQHPKEPRLWADRPRWARGQRTAPRDLQTAARAAYDAFARQGDVVGGIEAAARVAQARRPDFTAVDLLEYLRAFVVS